MKRTALAEKGGEKMALRETVCASLLTVGEPISLSTQSLERITKVAANHTARPNMKITEVVPKK